MTGIAEDATMAMDGDSRPPDSEAPKEMELTQLGRYRLCFKLASGGMATVYLARLAGAEGFEKVVALKRIHPHLVDKRSYVDMFLDEARIASGITHPNVCSVFDFGESDGEYYLAMEYLVGEPLARVIDRARESSEQRDSRLPALRMARIIEEACEGLHAAHESTDANGRMLNVIHRDVTPRNLFMTYSGVVQVVDFGVASARQRIHRTSTGQLKGTMPYMAPEQISGGNADRRLDVWSLGVVLWEALTLDRLFKRETEVESMYAVLVDDIPPPSERRPGIPAELESIVMKALQRDPNKRWHTAREMGQALHAFAAKQATVVGTADLSQWMHELFPKGEARKREIMELAMTAASHVHPASESLSAEVSGARTVAAGIFPAANPRRSSKGVRLAVAGGVLLAAGAAAWGFQQFSSMSPTEATLPVAEPVVATDPVVAAEATVEPEPPVEEPAQDAKAEPSEPTRAQDEPVAQPRTKRARTSSRRVSARKPSPRRAEQPLPVPIAKALSGHVKIVTKGHSVEIYEGRKLLGKAPATITLPAGRHTLRLKSVDSGESLSLPVNVVANATKTISLDVD